MGVQNPQSVNLSLYENPLTSRVESGRVIPASDSSWKTASAYTPTTTPFLLRMASLKTESGTIAYHKYASQYWEYKAVVAFTGGQPPFRITLLEAPASATIASGQSQTMTRSLDVIGGGVYKFELPTHNNLIRWQPVVGDVGTTQKFKILIEDNAGQQLINTHYVTVGESPFVYVDANAADDNGAGTWAAPKKTFNAAHNNADKICVYKTAGTYAVTFSGLNNSDNRSRNHIAIPTSGVIFDMSSIQFGCSTPASDVAFLNIEFNGSVVTNNNCRVFNLSGKVSRAMWYNCKWRNVEMGNVANDNHACIVLMGLGNPAGCDAFGRGPYKTLPDDRVHTDICVIGCDVDTSVKSQLIVGFGVTGQVLEMNTGIYSPTYSTVGGNNNGTNFLHAKDGTSRISVRFNVCYGGGFLSSPLLFSNQRGFYCNEQEAMFNVIKWDQGFGTSWNRQALYAGNTSLGQNVGATNTRCIRNTFISQNSGQIEFLRWNEMTGIADPVTFEGNVIATDHPTGFSGQTDVGAYSVVGVNPKLLPADVDVNLKLTGSSRTTYLGKQGGEIASTVMI